MAVETPFLSWDAERLCCHTLSCRAVCMTNQHTCFHRKHLTRWAICFHSREKKKKKKKARRKTPGQRHSSLTLAYVCLIWPSTWVPSRAPKPNCSSNPQLFNTGSPTSWLLWSALLMPSSLNQQNKHGSIDNITQLNTGHNPVRPCLCSRFY